MRATVAVASLLLACSGSPSDSAGAGPFTQADLEGSWRFATVFHGGPVMDGSIPGWERGAIELDRAGGYTATGEDSAGRAIGGGGNVHLDAQGLVTEAGAPSLAGRMSKGRDFLVATATDDTTPSIRIALKNVPGTAWSTTDVAGARFSYHFLGVGTDPSWEHGVASVDASGGMTLTERVATAGPQPDLAAGALSVGSAGIVTLSGDPTWSGYLSSDKSVLVATKTRDAAAHSYAVVVLTRLGQSFVQADLAGTYGFYRLVASTLGGGWARGQMIIDAGGTATMTSFNTNTGPQPVPGPQVVTLQPDGVIRNPASATYHSVMGFHKDLTVRTETTTTPAAPYAMLSISVK